MDPRYKTRFTDAMLEDALRRYGAAPESVEKLDGFESFIFSIAGPRGQELILRIGHSNRRPEALVQGEAEWINMLHAGGAGVARVVPSLQGRLVEPIADGQGEHFIAAAFEKAPGGELRPEQATPEVIQEWGRAVGRLHALSVGFQPRFPRPAFDDPIMLDPEGVLRTVPGEERVLERFAELRAALADLPRSDPAAYGMIHQDAHPGNFYITAGGKITLFDFDDCCTSWYVNDIAIVLFYAVMGWPDPLAFTRRFMGHFLRGYRGEKAVGREWLARIPLFLKLREIDLYAAIHRSFDVNNLTHPWVARYMDGRKQRIEQGAPYLDFDFSALE